MRKDALRNCATALAAAVYAAAAETVVMPLADKPSVVDGSMTDAEYAQGVTIGPFSRLHPILKWHRWDSEGDGTATFLTDGKTLCVAWRVKAWSVDFDGGLASGITRRDAPIVFNNDAVELEIGPGPDGRRAHFAVNPNGIVYDAMIGADGSEDVGWDCRGAVAKGSIAHGWWLMELSIPMSEVGVSAERFYVNAGRSGPSHSYSSLVGYEAAGRGKMLELAARKGAPAVKFVSPGNPIDGDWSTELACGTVPDGRRVRATSLIREIRGDDSNVAVASERSSVLDDAGEFTASFTTNSRAWYRAEISFSDADTGEILMKRDYVARAERKGSPIPATARGEIGEFGVLSAYDYPGFGKTRLTVAVNPGKGVEAVSGAFAGHSFELPRSDGGFSGIVASPCKEGRHPVEIAVRTKSGIENFPAVVTIVRKRREWEGMNIGRERVVVPPFKAIERKGAAFGVVLRECRFGAAALPSSVKSLGREILAAPAYFEIVVDGRKSVMRGDDAGVAVAADGIDARISGTASADGVSISADGVFEYDGFSFADYSLSGVKDRTVERLTLKIPLVDAEMPLMHVCVSDSIRSNPTGATPTGDGEVWNSFVLGRKTGGRKLMYAAQSVPYVWLGAEKRGLCWFMNNTCGLRLNPSIGSVRFVRGNGVLTVEIDLVNIKSALEDGHTFAFGFQSTPVKPIDKALMRHFQTSMGQTPERYIPRFCVGREIGGFWSGWARRPYGGDWSLFALAGRVAAGEKVQDEFMKACKANDLVHDEALEKYCADLPKIGTTPHFLWVKGCRAAERSFLAKGLKGRASYPYKYSDPTLNWNGEDEVAEYGAEWISRTCGYTGATRNFLTPSYLDYILFYYRKETEFGMKGLYFDDMFPMTCRNPDTAAKRDRDGTWHGNFGILEMRELVRRAAVMQHLAGIRPRLIQVHMTNCLLVPAFSFATSLLSWEDHFGEDVFQKRFRLDYLRAESLGSQLGAEAMALDGIKRKTSKNDEAWKKKFKFLTRTQQALLLPAGVKIWQRPPWPPDTGVDEAELYKMLGVLGKFAIWEDGCTFVPFYEDDGAIGGAPPHVITGSYRRKGEVLAVFGNLSGEEARFALKVDNLRLGLPVSHGAVDAESGAALDDGMVLVPPYDVRLVKIK